MLESLTVKHTLDIVIVNAAQRHKKLFALMLQHLWQQAVNLSCCAEEHLALTVLHILLYVEGNGLNETEILHVLRYRDTQFFRKCKEVVDGMT